MTSDQTHPTTPISDGDLQVAREAAAHEWRANAQIADLFLSGKCDHRPEVQSVLRALALSRQADERAAAEQRAAITAAGLDPTDPCDCILGDCKQSRMYCLEDRKRGYDKPRASNPPPDTAVAGEFVLVPREPTPHMILAARDHHSLPTSYEDHRVSIYRAMLAAAPPVPSRLRADADAELEELSVAESQAALARQVLSDYRSGRLAPASSGQGDADGWRDDPSADDRWNAGLDFGQTQLCAVLRVDPATVNWDAATETLDGDVQSVIRGILTAGLGEDWLEQRLLPAAPVEPGR